MTATLRKNTKYPFIRSALAKRYDKVALADILRRAENHYAALSAQCADAPHGEQFHLDNTILPTAAMYKARRPLRHPRRADQPVPDGQPDDALHPAHPGHEGAVHAAAAEDGAEDVRAGKRL